MLVHMALYLKAHSWYLNVTAKQLDVYPAFNFRLIWYKSKWKTAKKKNFYWTQTVLLVMNCINLKPPRSKLGLETLQSFLQFSSVDKERHYFLLQPSYWPFSLISLPSSAGGRQSPRCGGGYFIRRCFAHSHQKSYKANIFKMKRNKLKSPVKKLFLKWSYGIFVAMKINKTLEPDASIG